MIPIRNILGVRFGVHIFFILGCQNDLEKYVQNSKNEVQQYVKSV